MAMNTRVTIAKNAFFNSITAGSDVAINFFVSIVLARGLGTQQYGVYSFVMWLLTFFQLIVNFGLGEMAKRFIAEALGGGNKGKVSGITQLSLLSRGIAAALATTLLAVFSGFWAKAFGVPTYQAYFFLLALALLPNVLNTVTTSIFAGFQKYEYGAYLMLGTNPLRAVAVITLVVLGYGVREILLVSIAVWAVGNLLGIFLLRRLINLKDLVSPSVLDRAELHSALRYASTVGLVLTLDYFVWGQAEVFFLGRFRSAEEVGFYNLAAKLPSQIMTLIPLAFGAVLLPAVSEQFGRNDLVKIRTIYQTSARYLTMLAMPLAAIGIALASPLITVLYGDAYIAAAPIMSILFVAYATMAMDKGPLAIIYGINKPSFALKVGLLLATMNVGLCYWLVPKYGLPGAAIGSSIPRVLSLAFYIAFVSIKLKAGWPLKDTLKIVAASAATALVVIVAGMRLSPIVRVALAIPIGLPVYVAMLFVLRVFRRDDIQTLQAVLKSLPRTARRYCSPVISAVQKLAESRYVARKDNV